MEAVHVIRTLCDRPEEDIKPKVTVHKGPDTDHQEALNVLSGAFASIHRK